MKYLLIAACVLFAGCTSAKDAEAALKSVIEQCPAGGTTQVSVTISSWDGSATATCSAIVTPTPTESAKP